MKAEDGSTIRLGYKTKGDAWVCLHTCMHKHTDRDKDTDIHTSIHTHARAWYKDNAKMILVGY